MALETGTYVSDLVTTNPTSGDPVSQADDHLRLIKSTLQSTFPDATAPIYGLRAAATQATTSGTSIDFTSIPSWVKRITINLAGVSVSGTSVPCVQIGDSGGVEVAGYLGSVAVLQDALSPGTAAFSSSFAFGVSSSAASVYHGQIVLALVDAATFKWTYSANLGLSNVAASSVGGGSKALSATLDRVRLTTAGGADTFDAGAANIIYE